MSITYADKPCEKAVRVLPVIFLNESETHKKKCSTAVEATAMFLIRSDKYAGDELNGIAKIEIETAERLESACIR